MPTLSFMVLSLAAVAAIVQQYFIHDRRTQRRTYWGCTVVGTIASFFVFLPNLEKAFGMALVYLGMMTSVAYGYTPYIKIGKKVYALTVQDGRSDPDDEQTPEARVDPDYDPAPDAYSGLLTARKLWWVLVGIMFMSTVLVYGFIREPTGFSGAAIGIGFLLFAAVVTGIGDASWGYGIARGQRVQFGIASVITGGAFAALYLAAYYVGKRKPLRRTQSMEYRAHPRHRRTPE